VGALALVRTGPRPDALLPEPALLRVLTSPIAERSLPERLRDLDLPVLVVFGGADPRWDPSSARDYEIVPGVRIEMLPGVGHMAMLEAPDALNRTLVEFAAGGR